MIQLFGPLAPQCTGNPMITGESTCTLCDFLALIDNVVKFATQLVFVLVVIYMIWGAFLIITSGGSKDRVTKGRKIITSAIIGMVIVLGAWLIVSTVFLVVTGGYEGALPMPWYRIQC